MQYWPVGLEIVIKDSIKNLEEEVSRRLESGNWMLHGDWTILHGPAFDGAQSTTRYAQAMARMEFRQLAMPEIKPTSSLFVPQGPGPLPPALIH